MNLILFFNGWGMDEKIVEDVEIPIDYNLEIVNFPYNIDINLEKYEKIFLVGWSFGCYYLTKWLNLNKEILTSSKLKKIIALNGNSEIIGKYGITPKIFDFTLDTLTPDSLLKFYTNMGIEKDFKTPQKEFKLIREELEFFKENYTPLENIFTEIIIGKNDKIVPASRQKKYCQEKKIEYKEFNMGHYPFDTIKFWSEIL